MKYLFYFILITCGVCCNSSCQNESVAEYRLEKVDSIHISYYDNRLNSYVCIDNQEAIDSLCDIIYNSTTKYLVNFYPKMRISLYGDNQVQTFGVLKEYIKGNFSAKSKYNIEEILKHKYNESKSQGKESLIP